MPHPLTSALDTIASPEGAGVLAGASLLMVLVSLVAIPWFLCRLPEDYLLGENEGSRGGWWRRLLRNSVGSVLLVVGVLMLVLPGQGLLTIFVGLTLIDFPQKRRLIRRVLARPRLFKLINSIRERFERPPLRSPGPPTRQS